MKNKVIGLDIGGTAIKGALINAEGTILGQETMATCRDSGNEKFVETLYKFIINLARGSNKIDAVGLAIAGILSHDRSTLIESPNLPNLQHVRLKETLEQSLNCNVIVENDANAAALGELHYGAGKDFTSFLFFTLGTGIGSGLILEKTIWRGEMGKAGEFGHVSVEPDGILCGCGKRGCLEAYASGTAIIRMARKAALNNPETSLRAYADDPLVITPETVYACAIEGDSASRMIFKTMARSLAIGIANVNNLLDIHTFIVGGGISRSYDLFVPLIFDELEKRVFQTSQNRIEIIKATCGNDAGVLGAGFLAAE